MSNILDDMKSICVVYDVNFRNLLRTSEDVEGASLEGNVNITLTDPPFNVWNERNMGNSWRYIFILEHMNEFLELERQVMVAGAHEHVFCSCIQLPNGIRRSYVCRKRCQTLKPIYILKLAW